MGPAGITAVQMDSLHEALRRANGMIQDQSERIAALEAQLTLTGLDANNTLIEEVARLTKLVVDLSDDKRRLEEELRIQQTLADDEQPQRYSVVVVVMIVVPLVVAVTITIVNVLWSVWRFAL